MGSKSTKQTQTSTMTPTNPQFVTSGAEGLAGNIGKLSEADPGSFFAGAQPLNQQGFDIFGGLGAKGVDWLQQAAQGAGGAQQAFGYNPATMQGAQVGPTAQATAERGYDGLANYFNPYESQVIQNTMGDLDRARQLTQNGNGQGAVMAGQYGGSRQGVLDANANEGFLRAVGSTAGNLRQQGFRDAAGFGMADADRATGVSLANAGAANQASLAQAGFDQQAAGANQGAQNQAWQYNAGANDAAANRGLQGSQLMAQIGQYGLGGMMDAAGIQQLLAQLQAGAPLDVSGQLSGQFGSLPLGLFNGQTQTGTGTTTQSGGLGGILSGLGTGMFGLGSLGFSPFGKG
jgi:hypothetical protein